MPFLVTDGGNQIIVDATTGAATLPITVGPPCMIKVVDAWWQDAASANALVFQDSKGRTFRFLYPSSLDPVAIGKLDWMEGPITVTTMGGGVLYFVLGNK